MKKEKKIWITIFIGIMIFVSIGIIGNEELKLNDKLAIIIVLGFLTLFLMWFIKIVYKSILVIRVEEKDNKFYIYANQKIFFNENQKDNFYSKNLSFITFDGEPLFKYSLLQGFSGDVFVENIFNNKYNGLIRIYRGIIEENKHCFYLNKYDSFANILNKLKTFQNNKSNYYTETLIKYNKGDLLCMIDNNKFSEKEIKELDKEREIKYCKNSYNSNFVLIEINDSKITYKKDTYWDSEGNDLYMKKEMGDFVEKGEAIITNSYIGGENIIIAGISGIIDFSDDFLKYTLKDKIFGIGKEIYDKNIDLITIYKNPSNDLIDSIKKRKFKNVPVIKNDDFTGDKEILWSTILGKINYNFLFTDNDFHFTINYINNSDYLIFRNVINELKISLLDKISFLLGNGEILDFIIVEKPYKVGKGLYESKIKITFDEINKLKDFGIKKWQIIFMENGNKIQGDFNDEEFVFKTKLFFSDYLNIVNKEIQNYKPLLKINNNVIEKSKDKIKTECYLYVMHDTVNGFHKIGISNNPEYREKTLQSEKPSIEMIANKKFINRDIAFAFEQSLHKTYHLKRLRGEWFDLSDEELEDLLYTIKN